MDAKSLRVSIFVCLALFLLGYAAFAISTVAGGGAGLLLLPLVGLVIPAAQAPAALSIGTTASSATRLAVFRRSVRWDIVGSFLPAAFPAAALGAWLLTRVAPLYLELVLGLFLIGNVLLLLRGQAPSRARVGRLAWWGIGAAGGFVSGFTGAIGVLLNSFYIRSGLTKEEIIATRAANEILLHILKLGIYAAFGLMTRETLAAGAILALSAILAPVCMKHLLPILSETTFRKISHVAMLIAGTAMIGGSASTLADQHRIVVSGNVGLGGLEAQLSWEDWSASVDWAVGRFPELERTIDPEALPVQMRELVALARDGADRIICERVHRLGGSGYEVVIYKQSSRTKAEI